MPLAKRKVKRQLLVELRFQEVQGSKHEAVAFFHGGHKVATTRFSRGSGRELDDTLLKVMAREVRVFNLSFFKDMIDCPRTLDDYVKKLGEAGYL